MQGGRSHLLVYEVRSAGAATELWDQLHQGGILMLPPLIFLRELLEKASRR